MIRFWVHHWAAILLQIYTYVNFPSETITRSGYQIRRKSFGVVAKRKGTAYSLVAR